METQVKKKKTIKKHKPKPKGDQGRWERLNRYLIKQKKKKKMETMATNQAKRRGEARKHTHIKKVREDTGFPKGRE